MNELFFDRGLKRGLHTLDKEESTHLVKVLRKKRGDTVYLTDGAGNIFEAIITEASPKACVLDVGEARTENDKRAYWITMAVAPTKNISRFEWFVEKAVEMGVDQIIPLITDHSERKSINSMRVEKVAISAMKQSFKARLPLLSEPLTFTEALNSTSDMRRLIACLDDTPVPHLADVLSDSTRFTIFIGPEGDFSSEEKTIAISQGVQQVHLGPYRLRSETAALVACQTVHLIFRDKK